MASGDHLILVLRHGIAEPESPSVPDEERALTSEGKRKVREVARGMQELELPIDRILTSPLRRARETAAIVADAFGLADGVEVTDALSPGAGAEAVFRALASGRHSARASARATVLVGHEPDLGELVSTLLVGTAGLLQVQFKKAGLAGVAVASLPPRAAGVLEFFLTPGQLRAIGRKS